MTARKSIAATYKNIRAICVLVDCGICDGTKKSTASDQGGRIDCAWCRGTGMVQRAIKVEELAEVLREDAKRRRRR